MLKKYYNNVTDNSSFVKKEIRVPGLTSLSDMYSCDSELYICAD